MPFSRSDDGVVFDGDTKINSQGVMYFPTGDTSHRGRGRAVFAGGFYGDSGQPNSQTSRDTIDYVTIAQAGNALDFADMSSTRRGASGGASPTRGLFCGSATPQASCSSPHWQQLVFYLPPRARPVWDRRRRDTTATLSRDA